MILTYAFTANGKSSRKRGHSSATQLIILIQPASARRLMLGGCEWAHVPSPPKSDHPLKPSLLGPPKKNDAAQLWLGFLTRVGGIYLLASDRRQPRKSLMGVWQAGGWAGLGWGAGFDGTICRVGLTPRAQLIKFNYLALLVCVLVVALGKCIFDDDL